jgi:putative phosphoribosyl transferase
MLKTRANTLLDLLKNKFQLRFKNRIFVAKILAGALEDTLKKMKIDKKKDLMLILGIPRGGVIVADVVATQPSDNCEFDIVIPRKLTAPHNQEIAIGAVMEDGMLFLNYEITTELEINKEYIEKEKARQLEEIKRRKSLYCRSLKKVYDIQDKIVILVDDGAATGATLIAAARWIRKQKPKKLVIAIPVTSKDTVMMLKMECDVVVTGATPSSSVFKTVGQYYQEFKPVEDKQVIEVCRNRKQISL